MHCYVDRYGFSSILAVLLGLMLSVMDAFLTLKILSIGGTELNPFMNFMLEFGPIPFLIVKYVVTAVALVVLLVHKNYRLLGGRLSVNALLIAVPLCYVILIAYELLLIFPPG